MIVVDTGVLLAAVNAKDRHHDATVGLLASNAGRLVMPAPVMAETAWMIESVGGPLVEANFVASVANGELSVKDLDLDDYGRCVELIEGYGDLGLGLVDASVVAIPERLGLTTVATLNHRDFRVVRPSHCAAFDLVP